MTTVADVGAGSFRQAILSANTNPGPDMIVFQISGTPPFTITPLTALPAILDAVTIDGTTQPGFTNKPVIELNGSSTSGSAIGLKFIAGSSILRGLTLNRFPNQAIELDSAGNIVQGNFIGTDVTGALARGNGTYGILVKSADNLIGGTNAGDGNVISGGNDTGIYFLNASNNVAQGNLIGVAASGISSLGNVHNGIIINAGGGNVIGGATSGARNVVSGNGASGIYLNDPAATGNLIQGNRIGTDISGSNAVGNVAGDGITLNGAPGNIISNNLISANGLAGISISAGASGNVMLGNFIGSDVNGKNAMGNHLAGVTISGANGNQVGGTNAGAGNLISGNVQDGILLTGGAVTNLIQGNFIGLSISGTNALRNGFNGITISGSSSNIIGGTVAAARNVISGNTNGIGILQLGDSGNCIFGNYIGTDATGGKAVSNALSGVRIQGCFNTVGGTVAGSGNVISGNGQQGVWLVGANGSVTGNSVQGNFIGLNSAGTGGLPNGNAGVGISSASGNEIGGIVSGARNIISANGNEGIFMIGSGTSGNQVQGNYIGTDASGTLGRGNFSEGIYMQQVGANLIGGGAPGAGNLISANFTGVWLTNVTGTVIQGNFIGTKADGVAGLGNVQHGIDIYNSTNNFIGGASAGEGNRIAFAQTIYSGVRVRDGSENNLISGNSIFSNGALGIDLGTFGVSSIYDCESGMAANAANGGQNFPVLANVYSGTMTRVRGTMDGKAGKTYSLQFFASPAGDASGYGEGQIFLGQTNLVLGSSCTSNFTAYLPATVPANWVVTATATDSTNDTSEFSAWVPVIAVPTPQIAFATDEGQFSVSWTNSGGSFALQQTSSLTPPAQWADVAVASVLTNGFFVTTMTPTNGSVFYRLAAQ